MINFLKLKKIIKIIIFNFLIFFILIFLFEIIFGYYLKKNNFGFMMRSERQKNQVYEVIHNDKKYIYRYKRNFYGFRGNEIEPSEIKIIFEGGSTGNQKFTPENLTIVGLINKKLKKSDKKFEIINASTDGKTTKGYVNDFIFWFSKIENFNPDFIIFYTGINDSNLNQESKYDIPWREGIFLKIEDYFKNNSKTYELVKKFQFKYFNNDIRKEYGITKVQEDLYNDYSYINYQSALKIYQNYQNPKLINQFKKRLNLLKIEINKYNIKPIFITQIKYDGLGDGNLFIVNQVLKEFCKSNNYNIIKLDEKISNLGLNYFYDTMHTTPKGNQIIASKIYEELVEIIE